MIKAIIFDFAGVIGTDGYWVWLREKVSDIENSQSYFQDLVDEVDKGIISNQELVKTISKKVGVSGEIVRREIIEKVKINFQLLNLISRLKKKYKIGLLTNYTHEWMYELIFKYKLEKYFDVKVISSLHKVVKPDKKIYKITLDLLNVKPNEAIFIDDRQRNVDGGESVGIKSFLFTTNQKLKEDLKNFRISL